VSTRHDEHMAAAARRIHDVAAAFQRSRVLLTAYELGLFTVLHDEVRTSAEVADALGTDPRATDRLMNALVALGLLEKRETADRQAGPGALSAGGFANTPEGAALLVKGRPGYMALGHTGHLWATWSTLTDAVRRGRGVPRPEVGDRDGDWLRAFIAAMHYRGRQTAPGIVGLLDLSRVSRVLDVGGGSGVFSMAFVRAAAGISAVVFDLPSVLPLTRSYVEAEGFSGRVTTMAGDYLRDDLPAGFDLVFLSAVIHSNSASDNAALIRKAAGAVREGGQVVVVDWIMNEERTEPAMGALFALNMLVGTGAGDTYTEADVRAWMTAARLSGVTRHDAPAGQGVMVGRR
jgi:SAM-dependent methyltransferase